MLRDVWVLGEKIKPFIQPARACVSVQQQCTAIFEARVDSLGLPHPL